MSVKTENSRRVAKSRPVCMGLKAIIIRETGASNQTQTISCPQCVEV